MAALLSSLSFTIARDERWKKFYGVSTSTYVGSCCAGVGSSDLLRTQRFGCHPVTCP
jgi:hypothetical protein